MSQSMTSDSSYSPAQIFKSDLYKNINRSADITHVSNMSVPEIYSVAQLKRLDMKESISDNSMLICYAEKATLYDELFLVSDGQSWLGEDLSTLKISDALRLNVIAVGKKAESTLPEIRSLRYPEYISQDDSVDLKYEIYNPSEESMTCEIELLGKESIKTHKITLDAFRSQSIHDRIAFDNMGTHILSWRLKNVNGDKLLHKEILQVKAAKLNVVFYAQPLDRDLAMLKFVLEDIDRYQCYNYNDWAEEYPQKTPDVFITNRTGFIAQELEIAPTLVFYRHKNAEYDSGEELKVKSYRPWLMINEDLYENTRYWSQLPPVQVIKQAPQGQVLLEDENGRPVIVDLGGVTQINAQGLWKWNLAAYGKDWDGLYEILFTGIIEELIGSQSAKTLSFNKDQYHAYAFRQLGFDLDLADGFSENYELYISVKDSNKQEVKKIESRNANQTFYIKLDEAGEYLLKAVLTVDGESLAADSANVNVMLNDLEKTRLGLRASYLKKLCENNHGDYISYALLDTLSYDLKVKDKQVIVEKTYILRDMYIFYVLLFLALVADWILRKINGGI